MRTARWSVVYGWGWVARGCAKVGELSTGWWVVVAAGRAWRLASV